MGTHTPTMSQDDLKTYLKDHLSNELEWLLRAATEWHFQNEIELKIDGYHMQVYALDSSVLHARTLFEFFTKRTSNNYYGCDAYEIEIIQSHLYTSDWAGPMHAHLMHAQDRSHPRPLMSYDRSIDKDLNKMPVDFAKEIVHLWREFENRLERHSNPGIQAFHELAKDILVTAIDNAKRVVHSAERVENGKKVEEYSVTPLIW